jgi:hypothetical protein
LDAITDVTTTFLTNLGRTLRFYADTQASKMSAEEMILHTLYQNGTRDVSQLEHYARDDVERHGVKLADLAKKMQAAYTDTVRRFGSFPSVVPASLADPCRFSPSARGRSNRPSSRTTCSSRAMARCSCRQSWPKPP